MNSILESDSPCTPKARPRIAKLSIVSPVFNEKDNLQPFLEEVCATLDGLEDRVQAEIIFVNDGSSDGSTEVLEEAVRRHPGVVTVIHLSRNFGLEVAVSAGLDHSTGDAVVVMDSDMQDDPAVLPELLSNWRKGYDIVYVTRSSRKEPVFTRIAFWAFYRLVQWMSDVDLPLDASNFALMDRRVVKTLCGLPERNRYLRGLRAWVGYEQIGVPMPRRERQGHETRLGFRGQWRLAMDGIFAFSYLPLHVFRIMGVASLGISACLILYALSAKLLMGIELQAWTSLMVAISFFGGINLFGLGVLGEYIARIFDEVKNRPLYIVDRVSKGSADER